MAGLYRSSRIHLTGVWKPEKSKTWQLQPQTHYYFVHTVELERPFKSTKPPKLRLPSAVWKKVSAESKAKTIYRQKVRRLRSTIQDELTQDCWLAPLQSKTTSEFGKPRFLPSGRKYYHSGVDLRAPTGIPLKAMSAGKVALSEKSIVPGNTVLIDHGGGIYSQYMHMSRLDVKVGDLVQPGQIIGLSGATGRVEGPHLHWEVSWKGRRANPFSFLSKMSGC